MSIMTGVKRPLEAVLGTDHQTLDHRHYDRHNGGDRNQARGMATMPLHQAMATEEAIDMTTRTPSPTFPPLSGEIPDFSADASLVLVGIRGAGKSTLAIMASSALKRRVVDLENVFQRTRFASSAVYKKLHGSTECHRQQAKVLHNVLERNKTGCVIVCSWMESRVQALFREFAATHPVVHVVRDGDAIQEHLRIQDREKMENLLKVSRAIFGTCTNFEFYNVTERQPDVLDSLSSDTIFDPVPAPYLTLKHAERHLLRFLSLIYPQGALPFMDSAFPLAGVPFEDLQFTYAVALPLSRTLENGFQIEDHVEGADVVQIVVDDLCAKADSFGSDDFLSLANAITCGIGLTRRSTVVPLAIDVKLPETPPEEISRFYLQLVLHTMRLAPELVTINLTLKDADIAHLIASKGRARTIGDCLVTHNPRPWTSHTWTTLYQKASRLGCDMVRLRRPAGTFNDNIAVGHFRGSVSSLQCRQIPLIAYNTGESGRHSAILNPILSTVAMRAEEESSPSSSLLLTSHAAVQALAAAYAYDRMRMYVFGVKVGYSMSPTMHNSAFHACGLPHHYTPHSTESLSAIKHLIEDPYFGGASIGLPFKVEVITLIHSLSRHARAIGAVNTLIPVRHLNPDGSLPQGADFFKAMGRAGSVKALYGENTDWIGIRACIRKGLSPANAVRPGACGVIVGAGGMARAAVYAMLQVGVQNILIYNRTLSRAEKLASHFKQLLQNPDFQSLGAGSETRFHIIEGLHDHLPSSYHLPTIIISCIPTHRIGEAPSPDFTVPDGWLESRTGGVIIELGYKTLNTPLLAQARRQASRGWVAMTGLDLLPEQGFAQFELFTGRRAPQKVMRRHLLNAYRDEHERSNQELQSRMPSEVREVI
ncbi:Quinate repressor protein-like protein [Emericellopsis cladophorae]|uniref:Quinate repressor protein-like protein n=1 Tax=Emericellopsis cladophorae TaxID=2686198 RepID=A0A9P9XV97_9HYPO|nr:Quinate repressor protein-like protein [Emericellopsis cladophorae]KAI6778034.1 Quinate repressor protein-like protein [Emericellopsis cladophorae]